MVELAKEESPGARVTRDWDFKYMYVRTVWDRRQKLKIHWGVTSVQRQETILLMMLDVGSFVDDGVRLSKINYERLVAVSFWCVSLFSYAAGERRINRRHSRRVQTRRNASMFRLFYAFMMNLVDLPYQTVLISDPPFSHTCRISSFLIIVMS